MPLLSDNVMDEGLDYLSSHGSRVDICSQEPANFTEATSTHTLGNKTGLTTGAAENGDVSGRKVVVPAITDGSVTGTGTATHWALSKTTATTELLASQSLASSQGVTSGNVFSLTAADIGILDPS